MLIVDSHEDLAYNMLTFGRNYTRPAAETRRLEAGTLAPTVNGDSQLGWADYQRGNVALVFATLFAAPARARSGDWETQTYTTAEEAHSLYSAQLDAYHRLVETSPAYFRLVRNQKDLDEVLAPWQEQERQREILFESESDPIPNSEAVEAPADSGEPGAVPGNPVGLAILMEGAEGVRSPEDLEEWWRRGVRLIGPAWRGTRFCGGTREPGGLTQEGFALLEGMADLGFALDISHMDPAAALQALDRYPGVILASHSNMQRLLKGDETNRHLPDAVVRALLERDGVIGVVMKNDFLAPGWREKDGRQWVSLQHVAAQIDAICQVAGDARHAGLGTDFEGGFGLQQAPFEVDTISDLQKLVPLLADKGYSAQDIRSILGQNWLERLQRILAEAG